MVNIYNYLKTVFLRIREDALHNPSVLLVSLFLATIPLPYIYNSISVITSLCLAILIYGKKNLHIQKALLLPISLYFLMLLSLFWTIDFDKTSSSLVKELSLVGIPVLFFVLPKFDKEGTIKVTQYFSYAIFGYAVFYLAKATIRYFITHDSSVFFYHELVTMEVNAIHVSVYAAIAFFVFIIKPTKSIIDKIAIGVLFVLMVLLSSKNIIVVFLLLLLYYFKTASKKQIKTKYYLLAVFFLTVGGIVFFGKIKDRFLVEINPKAAQELINKENEPGSVNNITIYEAWNKESFQPNDYFSGFAMRVYQARIFFELLKEDSIFWKGYGLDASWNKIKGKRIQHNLYEGYDKFNFHNQYIQNFAELGIFGFLLLLLIVSLNLKNAIYNKDFIHISFAILMISLFLTESFLWRQRGVVFFTTMYCLFNSRIVVNDSLKEK